MIDIGHIDCLKNISISNIRCYRTDVVFLPVQMPFLVNGLYVFLVDSLSDATSIEFVVSLTFNHV